MRYIKKPIEVDAMVWDGTKKGASNIVSALERRDAVYSIHLEVFDEFMYVHTLEGAMKAEPGDFIIRGVKGEVYPCKPDIFALTYEPVKEEITYIESCVFCSGKNPMSPALWEQMRVSHFEYGHNEEATKE